MDELIYRSAFRKEMQEYIFPIIENNLMGAADVYYRTLHLLEETPAVDAVEVVRCEKCVHFDIIDGTPYCHYWSRNTEESGFCHNGI